MEVYIINFRRQDGKQVILPSGKEYIISMPEYEMIKVVALEEGEYEEHKQINEE